MKASARICLLALLSFCSSLSPAFNCYAELADETLPGYVLVKVADTNTLIPSGVGSFLEFGTPAFNGGTIAFRADGILGQKGIYAFHDGSLTRIADLNTPAPGADGDFTFFSSVNLTHLVSVASDGSVAFIGQHAKGMGIYTNRTGALTVLADNRYVVPGNILGRFLNFFAIAYDAAQVAFTALSTPFHQGLYLADGNAVSLIADQNTRIPGGMGNFTDFGLSSSAGYPSLHAGNIVFNGSGDFNQSGVYSTIGGALRVIADQKTLIPGTLTAFGSFNNNISERSAIRGSDVVFNNDGIYAVRGGDLKTVANFSSGIPGSFLLRFTSFGPPAIDNGKVTFAGVSALTYVPYPYPIVLASGVYTDIQGPLKSVAGRSLRIDGKLVSAVISGTESLSNGMFALKVVFSEGTHQGIYVAKPM
jgi:hypothetical protein